MKNTNREEILRVRNLKQYFKVGSGKRGITIKAVDDVSFSIYKGEVFSLVGESGCGKTTTGRTIIRLYDATAGEVHFHGTRIVSDYKLAKEEHKKLLKEYKEAKAQESGLSEEEESAWAEKLAVALEERKLAKRDKNFDKYVSEESLEKLAKLEETEEYIELTKVYEVHNEEIKKDLAQAQLEFEQANHVFLEIKDLEDKELVKEKSSDLKAKQKVVSNLEKELKLNNLRFKQDVKTLKYDIKYQNKILMRRMQMIFQDPVASLNPRMTIKEIVAEGLRISGVKNEKQIEERVNAALKTVKLLPEHGSRYPHEFSGGQRQRIGIARALIVDPTFIIADEPISNLDVSIRAQVINLLNDLRKEKEITILFIAHDLSVVKYFTDRLAVMYFGKIVELGDKDKIFNHPLHPYTKSLLASIPQPDPRYEQQRGKTERYNPHLEHDYSTDLPTLREIEPEHFVYCNQEEFERYQKIVKEK